MYRYGGFGDVTTGPVTTAPGAPVPPGPSSAPAGYWVNPTNASQYLPQSDAAKIGSLCMQGPAVGRYDVGGNYGNSVLFCKSLKCQEGLMIYGAVGLALFLLAPGAWKYLGVLPAGYAALNCSLEGGM